MRYYSFLPFSALLSVLAFSLLVSLNVLPSGMALLESLKVAFDEYLYLLILMIILAESIVYVGFYFPGQFFAVLLVVLSKPQWLDILYLTLCMVVGATLGSCINYYLGSRLRTTYEREQAVQKIQSRQNSSRQKHHPTKSEQTYSLKYLLIAMIHINSLAFYMFKQGEQNRPMRVVWYAGLLNLPYYLLLIFATSVLSEEVLQVAENTTFLIVMILFWLLVSAYFDYKKHQENR
jgi:membrane-associated protein